MKKLNKKDVVLLYTIFFPLFPLLVFFLGIFGSEALGLSVIPYSIVITCSVLAGFLLNFYFFRCLSANAFFMKNSSLVSVYLLYSMILLFIFRDFLFYNFATAFFAGAFAARRECFFGRKNFKQGTLVKIMAMTILTSQLSFAVSKTAVFPDFEMLRLGVFQKPFIDTANNIQKILVLTALTSLTALATILGFRLSTGKSSVDR